MLKYIIPAFLAWKLIQGGREAQAKTQPPEPVVIHPAKLAGEAKGEGKTQVSLSRDGRYVIIDLPDRRLPLIPISLGRGRKIVSFSPEIFPPGWTVRINPIAIPISEIGKSIGGFL